MAERICQKAGDGGICSICESPFPVGSTICLTGNHEIDRWYTVLPLDVQPAPTGVESGTRVAQTTAVPSNSIHCTHKGCGQLIPAGDDTCGAGHIQ